MTLSSIPQKIYTYIAIVAISAAAAFLILEPMRLQVVETRTDYEAEATRLELLHVDSTDVQQLQRTINTYEERFASTDAVYIHRSSAIDFITTIEQIATSQGVYMVFSIPEIDDTAQLPLPVMLQFDVIGMIDPLLDFLTALEQQPVYVNIQSPNISRIGTTDSGDNMKLNFSATTYWL